MHEQGDQVTLECIWPIDPSIKLNFSFYTSKVPELNGKQWSDLTDLSLDLKDEKVIDLGLSFWGENKEIKVLIIGQEQKL
ncbi:hypothetical protein OVS_03270 [Mycoplasma ovis str. Michigan]|uniref:Uncharacterized protein n=1 Tax=Mycoplasma ovis str. Michigan TaxID=1415773 RepID=A0ABM5P1R5_9MOLU|nr:hypothetical protein [Mycoplasma ovis]AHC40407.1 hypothetical protein OVS_03270 [Mycoplasma ovis str. Michigan]